MVEAEDFVSRFLVKALRVSGVVVGADFHFGHNRRGTPDFLRASGALHGFSVDILDLLPEGDEAVSSSRIRAALTAGDVKTANGLLGYHWFFGGEVVKGDQRGRAARLPDRQHGDARRPSASPRASMPCAPASASACSTASPASASRCSTTSCRRSRPSCSISTPTSTASYLEVALIGHIRGQEVYKGLDELIAAIGRDTRKARVALGECDAISDLDRTLGFFE